MLSEKEVFGSATHIERVLAEHSQSIFTLCFTYTHNIHDAEDIAQETFAAFIRHGKFESAEHEKAWLIRVAVNKCKNHLKSGWIKYTAPLEDAEDTADEPYEYNELLEAVKALPEKYRLPIHLFYYEGYSIKEIAKITEKKEATIGTLLSRGRQLLKEKLTGGNE